MKLTYTLRCLSFLVIVLLCYNIPAPAQKKKHDKKATEKKQPDKKQAEKKTADKKQPEEKQPEKKQPEEKQTDKKQPEKKQTEERSQNVCNCVFMKIQAEDTLSDEAYITYYFTVKNRCKDAVWINSSRFGFVVNNLNGSRPRVIRELQFVKRFIYPPFVLIKPNSEFQFKFADNPFDEYQLKRGSKYWFRFTYNNTSLKHPSGKNLNYLCKKELQRLVYVR